MGIIITAAFATSARRQLVTLGQLSANGADHRLLRRTLSLQGSWSGFLGSLLGVGAAIGALTMFRRTVEQLLRHDPGPYVYSLSDLTIILLTGVAAATVAAFVPARTITRVPVLSALGGRRPLGAVPRRLVPTGLALFAGGVGLLALVAAGSRGANGGGDLFAVAAVIGGLAVLGGVCCISPVFVGGFGGISSRLGGSGRLAARSLARVRTRSAAVVTAIATAGAVAVAIATFVGMNSRATHTPSLPDDVVTLTRYEVPAEGATAEPPPQPVSAEARATVDRIVPGIRFAPLRHATPSPPPPRYATEQPLEQQTDPYGPEHVLPTSLTVADPAILAAIGLSERDTTALEKTGALELYSMDGDREPVAETVTFTTGSGPFTAAIRRDEPASEGGAAGVLITPARAAELGFPVIADELIGTAPAPLTGDQRARLSSLLNQANEDSDYYVTDVPATDVYESALFASPPGVSSTTVQLAIVGGALLFTLLVVAIGLALSAAESRDERDVLVAVGARPRTLRRVAGSQGRAPRDRGRAARDSHGVRAGDARRPGCDRGRRRDPARSCSRG